MRIKVVFKNGNKEEFEIDKHSISENGYCLTLEKDKQTIGMVNLSEVRFFKIEEEEPKHKFHNEDGCYYEIR